MRWVGRVSAVAVALIDSPHCERAARLHLFFSLCPRHSTAAPIVVRVSSMYPLLDSERQSLLRGVGPRHAQSAGEWQSQPDAAQSISQQPAAQRSAEPLLCTALVQSTPPQSIADSMRMPSRLLAAVLTVQ